MNFEIDVDPACLSEEIGQLYTLGREKILPEIPEAVQLNLYFTRCILDHACNELRKSLLEGIHPDLFSYDYESIPRYMAYPGDRDYYLEHRGNQRCITDFIKDNLGKNPLQRADNWFRSSIEKAVKVINGKKPKCTEIDRSTFSDLVMLELYNSKLFCLLLFEKLYREVLEIWMNDEQSDLAVYGIRFT